MKEKGPFLSLILRFGQIVKVCFRYFGPSLSTRLSGIRLQPRSAGGASRLVVSPVARHTCRAASRLLGECGYIRGSHACPRDRYLALTSESAKGLKGNITSPCLHAPKTRVVSSYFAASSTTRNIIILKRLRIIKIVRKR